MEAPGIDPNRLDETGWGVIFPAPRGKGDASFEIRAALQPLLDLRRKEAGRLYREFVDGDGYRSEDTKDSFLARQGVGPGPAQPERVPYYLLLAGGPDEIPFEFERGLSLNYAVGRIAFGSLDDYAAYARSVATTETATSVRGRSAALFGAAGSGGDGSSRWSAALLSSLGTSLPLPPADVERAVGTEATKARLAQLLEKRDGPSLVIVSGHSVGFPTNASRRAREQGALVCGNWEKPATTDTGRPVPPSFLFGAQDVPTSADLTGRMGLLHASFSAGFLDTQSESRQAMSKRPQPRRPAGQLAPLAQALLANRGGGMLAVIGWTNEIWSSGAPDGEDGRRSAMFYESLAALLAGQSVGRAFAPVRQAYAGAVVELADALEKAQYSNQVDEATLVALWALREEAAGCVIIGDPAVRLTFAAETAGQASGDASQRPYYDAEADTKAREEYYRGVNSQLSPTELFAALNKQLEGTHTTRLKSSPAEHLYPWVEMRPDMRLHCIYSDVAFDSASGAGARPYNTERAVPSSRYDQEEPMRGDLHDQFACSATCNSYRGSTPYAELAPDVEARTNDCGRRVEQGFRPASAEGRGAVARGVLYFLLRYPRKMKAVQGEQDATWLKTLLAWHRESAPGEYERHRNAAIFEKQGNRNPLIDFPEWAERIAFTQGMRPAQPTKAQRLSGKQSAELNQILADAFGSLRRLEGMLRIRLNKNLGDITRSGDMRAAAFDVTRAAEAQGWLMELLMAARSSNPANGDLLVFAQQFGLAPRSTPDRPEVERFLVQTNSSLDATQWYAKLGESEARVCRIDVDGRPSFTGFLLGPSVLLTSDLATDGLREGRDGFKRLVARFDVRVEDDGHVLSPGVECRLAEDWLIDYSPRGMPEREAAARSVLPSPDELGYALLRLNRPIGNEPVGGKGEPDAPPRGWFGLPDRSATLPDGPGLSLIYYPRSGPFSLASDTAVTLNSTGTRFRYLVNTDEGAIGSPVFDSNWELIALHAGADQSIAPAYQEGVPVSAIREALNRRGFLGRVIS